MDPQITLAKVLRPYDDFEDVYNGQAAIVGVPFFEPDSAGEYSALEEDAGKPGFASNLIRYTNVPMGARILIWVPACFVLAGGVVVQTSYRYRMHWRIRNVTDFRNRRRPYHNKRQFPGQPDTTDATNPQRTIIPAASRSVVINQEEIAAPPGGTQIQHLRRESIDFLADALNDSEYGQGSAPLVPPPGGVGPFVPGAHQQGVLDPAAFPLPGGQPQDATNAIFMPFWFDAEGDQLLITAVRDDADVLADPWDFGGVDAPFSNIYGRNFLGPQHGLFDGVGIYLFTGVTY